MISFLLQIFPRRAEFKEVLGQKLLEMIMIPAVPRLEKRTFELDQLFSLNIFLARHPEGAFRSHFLYLRSHCEAPNFQIYYNFFT